VAALAHGRRADRPAARGAALRGPAAGGQVGSVLAEVLAAVVVAAVAAVDSKYGFFEKTHERHVAWQSSQSLDASRNS